MCCAQDSISVTMQLYCMCMCCMCDKYMCQAVYITMCVHKCVHVHVHVVHSVKMRTQSLSKWYKPSLCVCVCVGGVYRHLHARCIVTNVRAL